MSGRKEPIMWTKDEILTVLKMWQSHSVRQIADELGREDWQIANIAFRLRKEGANIPKKRVKGEFEHMIREVLSEL